MLRKLLFGVFALLLCIGLIVADEAKGKFKKQAGEKGKRTLVVTVGDKDEEFSLAKESKVFKGSDEVTKKEKAAALKGLKEGDEVTVIFDKDGDKKVIKELKIK
jgi:Cu/Ag efflux protein CusF